MCVFIKFLFIYSIDIYIYYVICNILYIYKIKERPFLEAILRILRCRATVHWEELRLGVDNQL